MRNCVFHSVADTSFIETQLTIESKNLKFIYNEQKKWQATVQVTVLYLKDSVVVKHLKYLLFSELIDDTLSIKYNLADLKRVSLPNGNYSIEIYLQDYNQQQSTGFLAEEIKINYQKDSLSISDIELVESYNESKTKSIYTKNGFDILPYTIQYYPTALSKLTFYAEIYNSDFYFKQDNFLTSIYIRESLSGKALENFIFNSKQTPASTTVLFSSFNISKLPTGNYFLTIEIRNKKNEQVADRNLFFIRTNTAIVFNPQFLDSLKVAAEFENKLTDDSLNFFIQSLNPIASNDEHNYISYLKKSTDYSVMRAFIYKFWLQRNVINPYGEWEIYKSSVYAVENNFKTQISHGYETDRGIIYLKYGAPDQINKSEHEPGTYPYEIWHYYFISPNQSNVHFIFYNSDLVTNNYKLIHSDAIGEIKNPRWKFMLNDAFKNKKGVTNTDVTEFPDSWGSHADEFMK